MLLGPTSVAVAQTGTPAQTSPESCLRMERFAVPAGDHPHDVAPAADGGVWYTAQALGALGWLDPTTGEDAQIPLGEGSAPHGVIVGPDGAPWVTDGGLNAIVRVDPETQRGRALPAAGGAARQPQHGRLRSETASSGSPGRTASTAGSIPTQRQRASVWSRAEGPRPTGSPPRRTATSTSRRSRAATSAAIDLETGDASRSIDPPTPRSGRAPRLVRLDGADLGQRVERRPGRACTTRPRASGASGGCPATTPQAYAVYVDERDVVWLSDFGANALVRFDPRDRDVRRRCRSRAAGAKCGRSSAVRARSGARSPAPTR